jgi:hypothetical protein
MAKLVEKHAPDTGMKFLSVDEHRELFTNAGYSDVEIDVKPEKGWICATGRKAAIPRGSDYRDDRNDWRP